MSSRQPDFSNTYTFSDMGTWSEPERFELVDGTPFMLASPGVEHEDVSTQLRAAFNGFVRQYRPECRVYGDPAGVLLEDGERNVVRPDVFVMCHYRIQNGQMIGIPSFVAEILSKSTASFDVHAKYRLYERFGVPEYWIVDPIHQLVQVYRLEEGKYAFQGQHGKEDQIVVKGFDESLAITLDEIFLLDL